MNSFNILDPEKAGIRLLHFICSTSPIGAKLRDVHILRHILGVTLLEGSAVILHKFGVIITYPHLIYNYVVMNIIYLTYIIYDILINISHWNMRIVCDSFQLRRCRQLILSQPYWVTEGLAKSTIIPSIIHKWRMKGTCDIDGSLTVLRYSHKHRLRHKPTHYLPWLI